MTLQAQKRLETGEIWFHLGGGYQDGDPYDTQEVAASKNLDVFRTDMVGPDKSRHLQLMEAANGASHDCRAITINRGGA